MTQPGWYTVTLLSGDERQLVTTRVPWGSPPVPIPDPESLKRLMTTGQPVVGHIHQTPRGGPEHLVAVRIPIVRDGTLKYALSAVLNVESLAGIVPRRQADSQEWTRTILDAKGTIAVRTRGAENYVGSPATDAFRERIQREPEFVSSGTTREGIPVYSAVRRGSFGWTNVVVVPSSVLDAPLRASMTGVLVGGVLLMSCGLIATLIVSRRLSSDLISARAAAEALAEGRTLPHPRAHVDETQRLQASLASAAQLLDKRARERDEQIQQADAARAQAEAANRTKDQFLAVLGHELRNPLAPAVTALELMKMRDPAVFARERGVLERQVAHMSRLVNDLLDLSRLARGKVQVDRHRFELRDAVDRAVDMARPMIVLHNHALTVSVPPSGLTIDGDIDRIVQVLSNLLTNAANYTPPGGEIAIKASAAGDRVIVTCEDNGPGIAADLRPTLFDAFAQGPRALDRREGGLGLGLALARAFTELHDGTINLEARTNGHAGSRFVIDLPLAAAASPTVAAEPRVQRLRSVGRRVLVVDDNIDAREMLQSALENAGHVVAVARSGHEAIARAQEAGFDVGVLDIGLPGMSGYDLARELRSIHRGIRLIALTGYGQLGDREAASAAGFDAHCTKPVSTSVLLDEIDGGDRVTH